MFFRNYGSIDPMRVQNNISNKRCSCINNKMIDRLATNLYQVCI